MVFVLDKHKKPLMPCTEKRARLLLERKQAVIHKYYPFTIRLKNRIGGEFQAVRVKLDPGSKQTGVAVVREYAANNQSVIFLFELQHRGDTIRNNLSKRSAFRGRRRSVNIRHRTRRYLNRRKPGGWLAPSLRHRVDSTISWMRRLQRLCPVTSFSQELVKFDTQVLENPDISSVQYQQGTLAGYELREYILERDGRKCVYCGAKNTPFNLDHIEPRSKGGSNRPSNLVLACIRCNQRKGDASILKFLKRKPALLVKIMAQVKRSLRDVAAVNATRWALYRALDMFTLPVEVGTGGRTKWNRNRFGLPKTHALDAACVGVVEAIRGIRVPTLSITCMGRGTYQRTISNAFGFPHSYRARCKKAYGFQTGDIVSATLGRASLPSVHVG